METRLAPLQNAGPSLEGPPSVRWNHPPGAAVAVGAVFALAGPSARAARLVPVAASVLTLLLLHGLVRRLFGRAVALAAAALFAASPFVAIYGGMVSYEPLVLLAWTAALAASARHAERGGRWPVALAAVAVSLGLWTDWAMVPLAAGLVLAEAVAVLGRRPRRPGLLVGLASALVLALAALAVYYLVVLEVDGGELGSLYRFRSSVGGWRAADVAAHVGSRTATLLTWPVVVLGALGLVWTLVGRPGGPGPRLPNGRVLLLVGLLAPPLALLVALPQHAVIHAFAAIYLLPVATICAAVAAVGAGRALRARAGRLAAAGFGLLLGAVAIWQAAPVVADGWVSDGSPLEGRPRLAYEHLVVAGHARRQTLEGSRLLVDPTTRVTGVRAWFELDRAVRLLGRGESVEDALSSSGAALGLFEASRLGQESVRDLLDRHGGTLVGSVLAVRPDRRRGGIDVLELVEDEPGPLWAWHGSACYPPHRLVRAPARAAAYRAQLRGGPSAPPAAASPAGLGPAELAARHLLALGSDEAEAAERALLGRLTVRGGGSLCPGLELAGAVLEAGPSGATRLAVVLRAREPVGLAPRLTAILLGPRGPRQVELSSDDALEFPEGSYLVASKRIDELLAEGRYVLEVRACGRQARLPAVGLRPRTLLPVHRPVGRL